MRNNKPDRKPFDFVNRLKVALILYGALLLVGVICTVIFGVKLDINFKGGTRFTYTHTGDIAASDAKTIIEDVLKQTVTVNETTAISGDGKRLMVSLVADQSISAEAQENITKTLREKYPDQNVELYDSNSVSPAVAGSFFAKSLFAVALASLLVVVYVGFRFRKIGGVSAGIMALAALVCDVLVSFFVCVLFRLQIDANFMAVVLTILGYSLNDTIVVYDRIRENNRLYPALSTRELVNKSLHQVKTRTINTSITTFLAVTTIVVVAELFGLTTLRSFAIPMAFGIVSGCYSSLCLSAPLWVRWREYADPRKAAKKAKRAASK